MWKELITLWKSDNLFMQALNQSYEMLEIAHEMFKEAVESLRHTDTDVDVETKKKDKIINKYEREVRRKVITHLSVQGGGDLPAGMVLITIIIDIERIGDYTKNILDLATLHISKLESTDFLETITAVEQSVESMFVRTLECLKNNDEELALQLMAENKDVGKTCDEVISKLIKEEYPDLSVSDAVSLALYFRYLKRINSHLKNITSSVVNPFDRIGFKYKEK